MNTTEAKEILLLYRPGRDDGGDPEMAAALELVNRDPELKQWFDAHVSFQRQMRDKLRGIQPPAHLKDALLAERKIIRPQIWWRQPAAWSAAAAVVVICVGLSAFWLRPRADAGFETYQARMVGTALREYRMDIETHDMNRLRQFIASKGAPADYDLTHGLEKLALTGGAQLAWRSNPVAMVCFDRGDKQMLFLFVMKRAAVQNPPPSTPTVSKVSDMVTVSWTKGDNTYVLAGPDEPGFVEKYIGG